MERLCDARAKIERAEAQINDLNGHVRTFLDSRPYRLASEIETYGIEVWRYAITSKPPRVIGVIAGEVLHNLRSALDHLACALAEQHSGSNKGTYFPFGREAQIFKGELADKTKKLHPDARAMIVALKPYQGGNDLLWNLHDLNRRDKHITIVPIQLGITVDLSTLIVTTGQVLTVGPRTGRHFVRDTSNNLSQANPDAQPRIVEVGGEPRLAFDTGDGSEENFELATALQGTEFEADFQPTFDISIRELEVGKREPISAQLIQLRDLTQSIFLTFQRRFFP